MILTENEFEVFRCFNPALQHLAGLCIYMLFLKRELSLTLIYTNSNILRYTPVIEMKTDILINHVNVPITLFSLTDIQ